MSYLKYLRSMKQTRSANKSEKTVESSLRLMSALVGMGADDRFSDRRLKKDVIHLLTLDNGIRLYSFRYTWSNDFEYVGVMAQDLLLHPLFREAVTLENNSFYSVDYKRLGLKMITLSEWQTSQESVFSQRATAAA